MAHASLPPGPSLPRMVQGAYMLTKPMRGVRQLRKRYGDAFTVNVPVFGRVVIVSDPDDIRQLFLAGSETVDVFASNLGRVVGAGSLFALTGEEHRRQRKLLVPPFHGRRLEAHKRVIEEAVLREIASWPQDRSFPVLPSMMRATLDVILRAVFGADGAEHATLRELLPRMIVLGSRLAAIPVPPVRLGGWSPWSRLETMRQRYDAVMDRLIDTAVDADDLDERDDVLALLVQSRYDDGSRMSRREIADQLLTLLAAGHESTAVTLSWAIERLRRHPTLLRDLVDDLDAGGTVLCNAVVTEVQRTRPGVDLVGRQVKADTFTLGRWRIPKGYAVMASIVLVQNDEALFPDADAFDPTRFLGARPDHYTWIPFGGGVRRCVGAAFASMEMNVILRTVLREVTLVPTDEPDERWRSRGVFFAPAKGGQAVVRRRRASITSPLPGQG